MACLSFGPWTRHCVLGSVGGTWHPRLRKRYFPVPLLLYHSSCTTPPVPLLLPHSSGYRAPISLFQRAGNLYRLSAPPRPFFPRRRGGFFGPGGWSGLRRGGSSSSISSRCAGPSRSSNCPERMDHKKAHTITPARMTASMPAITSQRISQGPLINSSFRNLEKIYFLYVCINTTNSCGKNL